MRKFKWRLQRILDIKIKEEKVLIAQLNEIVKNIAVSQTKLMTLKIQLNNILDEIGDKFSHRTLREHELYMKATEYNDQAIKKLMSEISRMKTEQNDKTVRLVELKRFREGLEKLRRNAENEFAVERNKLEQNESDDRVAVKFCREQILSADSDIS